MVAETPQGIRVGGAYRILEEPGGLGVLHGDTQDGNRQKTPGYMGMCPGPRPAAGSLRAR